MSFEVRTISAFEKEFKKLSKKYPSLKSDLFKLLKQLEANPFVGTSVYLATIYDKSEKSNITDSELKLLANQIG